MTEAVFKIYKSAYKPNPAPDQVKLLKMRRIISQQEKDTIIARMKSGINASLSLDLIKELPDFLLTDEKIESYMYASSDIAVIDDRLAHVIYFEQKGNINSALYRGELYIDTETTHCSAPISKSTPNTLNRLPRCWWRKESQPKDHSPKSDLYRNIQTLQRPILHQPCPRRPLFRIKKRKQLFGTFPLHTWFEMVTCKIDTNRVSRFARSEALPTRTIFAETRFTYDEKFWGNFNMIPPEEKLNDAIGKISSKIEETEE